MNYSRWGTVSKELTAIIDKSHHHAHPKTALSNIYKQVSLRLKTWKLHTERVSSHQLLLIEPTKLNIPSDLIYLVISLPKYRLNFYWGRKHPQIFTSYFVIRPKNTGNYQKRISDRRCKVSEVGIIGGVLLVDFIWYRAKSKSFLPTDGASVL
jgi:hypothetical protein